MKPTETDWDRAVESALKGERLDGFQAPPDMPFMAVMLAVRAAILRNAEVNPYSIGLDVESSLPFGVCVSSLRTAWRITGWRNS